MRTVSHNTKSVKDPQQDKQDKHRQSLWKNLASGHYSGAYKGSALLKVPKLHSIDSTQFNSTRYCTVVEGMYQHLQLDRSNPFHAFIFYFTIFDFPWPPTLPH